MQHFVHKDQFNSRLIIVRYELLVDCCGRNVNLLKDILFHQISGCNLCKIKREKRDIFFDLGYIKYTTELYIAYKCL